MTITINGNGTVTGVSVGGLPDGIVDAGTLASNSVETAKIATEAVTSPKIGNGGIIQVVQGLKTDYFSTSTSLQTKAAITGLSVNITPTTSSNKILVIMQLGVVGASVDTTVGGIIVRDSTAIGIADASSNRTRNTFGCGIPATGADWRSHNVSHTILDSPATTSQITYSVHIGGNGTATITIGYDERNADLAGDTSLGSCSITAIEVVA